MSVADHMTREVLGVEPDAPLSEAARRMVERGVGAVVVLQDGGLAGILTERDVLKAVASGYDEGARVESFMTRRPETIESSDTAEHAATLMIHGGFRHLPVVDGEELVGILSIRDVMRVALQDFSPRGV